MLRIITTFFFLSWVILGHGQSYTFLNYSIPEGLPSTDVYDIYQDSKGFLWFATGGGVAKFDGHEIKVYLVKDGLSDPVVLGFYEDYKNRIWFRTYSGKLSYFEDGTIKPYPYNIQLGKVVSDDILYAIHLDEKDQLWFSTGIIFGKVSSSGIVTTTKEITKSRSLFYQSIDNGNIFSAHGLSNYIRKITINEQEFPIQLSDTLHHSKVFCVAHWNNKIYLSINNDLFQYDKKSVKKVFTASHPIISLSKDRENYLWIGLMANGVDRYQNQSFTNAQKLSFLNTKSISRVWQDHEGGFWFSTLEKGVYYVPNLTIENYTLPPNLKLSSLLSIHSSVLAGTVAGEVIVIDKNKKSVTKKMPFNSTIRGLYQDRMKRIWITDSNLNYIFDSTLTPKKTLPELYSFKYYNDNQGNTWAIGNRRITILSKEDKVLRGTYTPGLLRSIFIKDSLIYTTGRLGIQIWNISPKLIDIPKALANVKVSKIESLNDHTLFFGTIGNGFFLLNQKTGVYTNFNVDNDFIADNIYSALKTDSSLWLSTEKGLMIVRIKSLLRNHPEFQHITHQSGLLANEKSFMTPVENSVWVFTDEGFSTVPIDISNVIENNPKFYLKKNTINSIPFEDYKSKRFKYNENNVEISFGFIAFRNSDIKLRYRLSKTENWVIASSKKLLFTSLASGQYDIELEYSTDNVRWIPALTDTFTIAPPWWETWYFYLAILTSLTFISYLYYKNRLKQYREKHYLLKVINEHQHKLIQSEIETMERERSRIAKELHDGVGTNLTAIKLRVGQLLKQHNEPVAVDVEDQLQLTIKEIKDIIYGLTPSGLERYGLFASLKDYTERLNTTIQTKIDLNIFGKEMDKPEINLLIFRVLQELISNSIKHAQAKSITIHINSFEDLFSIVYEDDGVGFSYDSIKNGLGLNNIESRIQSVDGKLTFESGAFGVSYTIDIPVLKNNPT